MLAGGWGALSVGMMKKGGEKCLVEFHVHVAMRRIRSCDRAGAPESLTVIITTAEAKHVRTKPAFVTNGAVAP